MSLFNAGTQARQPLFGASSNSNTQPQPNNSPFAGSLNSAPQQSSNLFGSSLNKPQQQTSFGQSPQQQAPSLWGVSGGATTAQQQQLQLQTQPNQAQSSLFQNLNTSTLSQQQQTDTGLLSKPSLFGSINPGQSSQLQQVPETGQQRFQGASVWQPGSIVKEKTIPEQMQTLLEKWHPDSPNCMFQTYFYNNVGAENVPYYSPGLEEDSQKWEEALSKKPSEGMVPVLCKGFAALGHRVKTQILVCGQLQRRLHEINSCLEAILSDHELAISVKIMEARRRHVELSQRSLQLARKVQVLRNRGYALDHDEEELKKKLAELERNAFDPSLGSREEELWARMVGLREGARFLKEEFEKAGANAFENSDGGLDEEVLQKTKKILNDYDSQISHLAKELEAIRKDLGDYETTRVGVN